MAASCPGLVMPALIRHIASRDRSIGVVSPLALSFFHGWPIIEYLHTIIQSYLSETHSAAIPEAHLCERELCE